MSTSGQTNLENANLLNKMAQNAPFWSPCRQFGIDSRRAGGKGGAELLVAMDKLGNNWSQGVLVVVVANIFARCSAFGCWIYSISYSCVGWGLFMLTP